MEHGVPIRAISRCIAVLQVVNRHGTLALTDIARAAGLAYPTAVRIVQTLMHEGLIECEPDRKCYRSTALVQTLSQGFHNHDSLVATARPHIVTLTRKVGWPVAVVTRVGQSMMVRDSTHHLTSLTLNLYAPGYVMPLLECASGRVYIAHATDAEREAIVEGFAGIGISRPSLPLVGSDGGIQRISDQGYATCERNPHTHNPGKTSSISVPLFDNGRIAGALTLVFFASSMTMAEAVRRNLVDLQITAAAIALALARVASARTATPAIRHRAATIRRRPQAVRNETGDCSAEPALNSAKP